MNAVVHISDFELDLLAAGELNELRRPELRDHLLACERCAARREVLEREKEAFLARNDAAAFADGVIDAAIKHPYPAPLRIAALAAAIILCVAAGLWWRVQGGTGSSGDASSSSGTRIKGDVELLFFVADSGGARPGRNGETLGEGDRIRFAVHPLQTRYLFLVSVTDDGVITPFYPESWQPSIELEGSGLLDDSIALDDHVGTERVYALFSEIPLDPEAVLQSARAGLSSCRLPSCLEKLERLPIDARQASIWFRKE